MSHLNNKKKHEFFRSIYLASRACPSFFRIVAASKILILFSAYLCVFVEINYLFKTSTSDLYQSTSVLYLHRVNHLRTE